MTDLLQFTVSGLSLGAAYALTALGFVVIFRASQVFNFAHGEFLSVGAFTMASYVGVGLPWPIALVCAMVTTGLVAVLVERAVVRPMIGRPVFVTIILTIFAGYLLHAAIIIIWGLGPRQMPTPWDPLSAIEFAGASVLWSEVGVVIGSAVALALFFALLRYTSLGVAMRATSEDQEVALALGIPVGRVFTSTWFLAGAFAALAGVSLSMFPRQLHPDLGFVALRAFPAAIVGGLNSPVGTVIAGFGLGVLEMFTQAFLEPELGDFGKNIHIVFPYVIMILFLMVRPYGLFGTPDVERV